MPLMPPRFLRADICRRRRVGLQDAARALRYASYGRHVFGVSECCHAILLLRPYDAACLSSIFASADMPPSCLLH